MKKIQILQLAASATLLAVFNGCSGGSSNNLPPFQQGGSVGGLNSSTACGVSGINAEMCTQNFELTTDKTSQYGRCTNNRRGNVQQQQQQLCHVSLKGAESFSIDLPEDSNVLNESGLPILNPNSQNGGLPTGITVFPGDLLTIKMVDGHYSTHSSFGHRCSDDISVEGNQEIEGRDTLINNEQNGLQAGAYLEFVDGAGVRSNYQPVGRTAVKIRVPVSGSQTDPLMVLVGYNASALSCGDIKISYQIRRCLDSNLNTFDCAKL